MSTDKFLGLSNGTQTWYPATKTSSGVANANQIVATGPDGRLAASLMAAGIGAATETMIAFEALVAGDFVNIFDDNGTRKARKADNSNSRAANGFVLAAVGSNTNATVILQGVNTALTGLTIGTKYFLGTNGAVTTTAPTTANTIIQSLGIAVSATGINFEFNDTINVI
jgi:hypothetical protein